MAVVNNLGSIVLCIWIFYGAVTFPFYRFDAIMNFTDEQTAWLIEKLDIKLD